MTSAVPGETPVDEFEELVGAPIVPREPVLSGSRIDDWRDRIVSSPRGRRLLSWGPPAVVMVIALITRFWNLGNPGTINFDETFYVKDGWSLVNLGYSANWPDGADAAFARGDVWGWLTTPSFVVHPQLGKYFIGLGMALFGPTNPFSWRFATALCGVVAVLVLMVVAKKLFRSNLLATLAGLLFAIEGNAIVMSRVALLDNFVMLFALIGFWFILLDRGWSERRLSQWAAHRAKNGRGVDWGPAIWKRPWLIAAGLAFGLTASVKWSGLYFLAGFAVYTLVVDALARRRAGIPFFVTGTIVKQGPVTFLLTVPIAAAAYVALWTSWFVSDNSYDRHYADSAINQWTGPFAWVPHSIQSFLYYEWQVYQYNIGEARPHPYQANPLTWLFMVRPTSMYYLGSKLGENGCTTASCGASITGLANPLIWWAATAALFYLVYRLVRYREWRVGLILMGMVAGYLPWLLYIHRTIFQFYSIAFEPYMILALTFVIGLRLGSRNDPRPKRVAGIRLVAGFLVVAALLSVFFWPLWTGIQLDYNYLRLHWWLPSWI
ncbi:phospholipid carrier-dependent glycosyltransferase [soil metagenome]